MKVVDLHVHSKLSKSMPFDLMVFRRNVWQAKKVGLDGFALTEHFHAQGFWDTYSTLCRHYHYWDGVLLVDGGFRVLTGAELGIHEGCDLTLVGTLERLWQVDHRLRSPASSGYKPPFREAVAVAHEAGVMVIGAHMYRPKKPLVRVGSPNLRRLDALEMNGRDFYRDPFVAAAARRLRRPTVGGSDAHMWLQVGIKATLLPIDEITLADVEEAIHKGRAGVRRLSYGAAAVRVCRAFKKMTKARGTAMGEAPVALMIGEEEFIDTAA